MKRTSSLNSFRGFSDLENLDFCDDEIQPAEAQPASSHRSPRRGTNHDMPRASMQNENQRSHKRIRVGHTADASTPHLQDQPSTDLFACAKCSTSFQLASELHTHQESCHKAEKEFLCDQCGAVFSRKSSMKRHLQTVHLKERPYKCNECGKTFARKSNVSDHITTYHSNQTPYQCRHCHRSFATSRYRNRHSTYAHNSNP